MGNLIHQSFESRDQMVEAATDWILERLATRIEENGRASFFGSGGSTPGPVYEAMSHAPLDWSAVDLALVDDRWVPPTSDASNEKLLRRTLLQNRAADAVLTPMVTKADQDPFAETKAIGLAYTALCERPDVVILGMGPDAHVLSWFANARGLEAALDPKGTAPVAAIEAPKSDVTGDNLLRMTLTLPVMARTRFPLMLLSGEAKRDVYINAGPDTPVGKLISATEGRMVTFWSP